MVQGVYQDGDGNQGDICPDCGQRTRLTVAELNEFNAERHARGGAWLAEILRRCPAENIDDVADDLAGDDESITSGMVLSWAMLAADADEAIALDALCLDRPTPRDEASAPAWTLGHHLEAAVILKTIDRLRAVLAYNLSGRHGVTPRLIDAVISGRRADQQLRDRLCDYLRRYVPTVEPMEVYYPANRGKK